MQHSSLMRGAAVLTFAALSACDTMTTTPTPATDELVSQMEALGFRGDMVQDFGDYVLVEGDIRLEKSLLGGDDRLETSLRSVSPPPSDPTESALTSGLQYRTTNLVGSPKVHQLRVDLSGLNGLPNWQNAARTALAQWSAVPNSYVRLVEGTPADIRVGTGCLQSNTAATASWPSGGNPGPTITVNTCSAFVLNAQQSLHNMVHEFGHALGFRHTNWQSLGESASPAGAVHIPGTPTGSDNGSVMNGGTALNAWAGFSTYDQLATRTLYPLPAPVPTVTYVSGQPHLEWASAVGATFTVNRSYRASGYDEFGPFDAYGNVGTITNASSPFVDTEWPYTGTSSCHWDLGSNYWLEHSYYYEVVAQFPTGTTSGSVSAEIADCP